MLCGPNDTMHFPMTDIQRIRTRIRRPLFRSKAIEKANLFPVREAGEEGVFFFRQPGFFFFRLNSADQKCHITGKVTHGLQSFQIFFHIFGRETVNLIPVSAGNNRHTGNGEILVQHIKGSRKRRLSSAWESECCRKACPKKRETLRWGIRNKPGCR